MGKLLRKLLKKRNRKKLKYWKFKLQCDLRTSKKLTQWKQSKFPKKGGRRDLKYRQLKLPWNPPRFTQLTNKLTPFKQTKLPWKPFVFKRIESDQSKRETAQTSITSYFSTSSPSLSSFSKLM